MSKRSPEFVLVRHGETEWSLAGRHTGRSDIALTANGREQARSLAQRLAARSFTAVYTSPLVRARETCTLAGFADARILDTLREWDYGEFDGVTTDAIRREHPGWTVWSGVIPGGETPDDVGRRADTVVAELLAAGGDVVVFAHAHLLRVLAARWLELDARAGRYFTLDTASISVLGWEREQRVLRAWNGTR